MLDDEKSLMDQLANFGEIKVYLMMVIVVSIQIILFHNQIEKLIY